jgi:hypothetical protein
MLSTYLPVAFDVQYGIKTENSSTSLLLKFFVTYREEG